LGLTQKPRRASRASSPERWKKQCVKIVPVISAFLLLGGCTSTAPAPHHLNSLSKTLTAPNDKALVYIVRPYADYGRYRSPDFSLDGVKIGAIENRRYIYFYAYPMVLLLPTREIGGVETLKTPLVAGKTYFFKFDVLVGYKQLDEDDGRRYLNQLALSDIRPVVVGGPSSNLLVDAPSSNPVVDAPSSLPSTAIAREVSTEDYLTYDDSTRTGTIRYRAKMDQRSTVISKIEEICGTKNVALRAGDAMQSPAAYRTLDENIGNNLIQIRFQCLY
jgi:hypothetical protein